MQISVIKVRSQALVKESKQTKVYDTNEVIVVIYDLCATRFSNIKKTCDYL